MKGYKGKLFCLDLSFIGWYIVGALCLGIGVLWVTPYHQTARANFYEALQAEYGSKPIEQIAPLTEEKTEKTEEDTDDMFDE